MHTKVSLTPIIMHKTYVAYDATGVLDHEHSNLHTFQQIQEWNRLHPNRFDFLNMEEINFSSEHDDLVDSTVKSNFLRLMQEADNLLVLASPVMDVESPILNWQISKAVNRFRLPVIVAYVGIDKLSEDDIHTYWDRLPNKVRKYIGRDSARMAHIPLTRDKLERALSTYSMTKGIYPWNSKTIF